MEEDELALRLHGQSFIQEKVNSLSTNREKLWEIVAPFGTIKSYGAFYYLVPVPNGVSDNDAVDILATKFKILVMPGSPFGAPGFLRISYGNIPSQDVLNDLSRGLRYIREST
jgi:aspartate aminotransferase